FAFQCPPRAKRGEVPRRGGGDLPDFENRGLEAPHPAHHPEPVEGRPPSPRHAWGREACQFPFTPSAFQENMMAKTAKKAVVPARGKAATKVKAVRPAAKASYRKHVAFTGRMVMIGFGSIGQGVLPLILRHIDIKPSQITVISPED